MLVFCFPVVFVSTFVKRNVFIQMASFSRPDAFIFYRSRTYLSEDKMLKSFTQLGLNRIIVENSIIHLYTMSRSFICLATSTIHRSSLTLYVESTFNTHYVICNIVITTSQDFCFLCFSIRLSEK